MKLLRTVPLVLATTVALVGLVAPSQAAQIRPRIQGVVVDQGGRYVDDVQVMSVRPDGTVAASALTYASDRPDGPQHGYFYLAVGEPGSYTVTLVMAGYVPGDLGSQTVRRGVVSLGEVELTKKLVASSTRVSLDDSSLRVGQRGRVTVKVATDATPRPTGDVTLLVDGRKVDRKTLRPAQRGSVEFAVPKLGKGDHRVKATWSGPAYVKDSASKAVTLRIWKAPTVPCGPARGLPARGCCG